MKHKDTIAKRARVGKRKKGLPKSQYYAYIKSPEWQEKRRHFWKNSKRPKICAACRTNSKPLDLHHKTYKRLGCEGLGDLELLCRDCHESVHIAHRQDRQKGLWRITHRVIRKKMLEVSKDLPAPSPDELKRLEYMKGGFTRQRLMSWGVPFPPSQGWQKRLIKKFERQQQRI